MKEIILSIDSFSLSLAGERILENITCKIFKGEYVGLIGPNGAGKTSLLLAILKQYKPTSGKITLAKGITIGYVPQNLQLQAQFSISVEEFLSMGIRKYLKKLKKKKLIEKTLQDVSLPPSFMLKNFHLLSSGQKQRIIIARAIIHQPNFLLFDEPFNKVDFKTKIQIYKLLAKINQKYSITILFVSHEINYVVSQTNRVLCLNKTLHHGCHPLEFSNVGFAECSHQKIDIFSSGTQAIHHHH